MNRIIVINGFDEETKEQFQSKGYSVMNAEDYISDDIKSYEALGSAVNKESKTRTVCIDDCFSKENINFFLSNVECKVYFINISDEISDDDFRSSLNYKNVERTPYLCDRIIKEIQLADMTSAINKAETYIN